MCLGKHHSLQCVVAKLASFASQGKGRVTVSERGCVAKLAAKEVQTRLTRERLLQSSKSLQLLAQKMGLLDLPCPLQMASEGLSGASCSQPLISDSELSSVLTEVSSRLEDTATPAVVFEKRSKLLLQSDWSSWHSKKAENHPGFQAKKQQHTGWAELYRDCYLPLLTAEVEQKAESPEKAVVWSSSLFNLWILTAVNEWGEQARSALEGMVQAIRTVRFSHRASEGPPWEEMRELLLGACAPEHIDLLEAHCRRGSDPIFLDLLNGKGCFNANYSEPPDITLKMLQDQATELQASRALVFDHSDPQIQQILKDAGVRVSATVLAPKREPHGAIKTKKVRSFTECALTALMESHPQINTFTHLTTLGRKLLLLPLLHTNSYRRNVSILTTLFVS